MRLFLRAAALLRRSGLASTSRLQVLRLHHPHPVPLLQVVDLGTVEARRVALSTTLLLRLGCFADLDQEPPLSLLGKTCRGCAITVHSKCELKVRSSSVASRISLSPPTSFFAHAVLLCSPPQVPSNCKSATAASSSRLSSSNLSRSGSTASSYTPRNPVSAGSSRIPPSPFPTEEEEEERGGRSATVLFDFAPTSEFEVSLTGESSTRVSSFCATE